MIQVEWCMDKLLQFTVMSIPCINRDDPTFASFKDILSRVTGLVFHLSMNQDVQPVGVNGQQ